MKSILFNTEMVQAILDGRKTVTRRAVKPQPILYGLFEPCWNWDGIKAPYEVGDILYVREPWAVNNITPHDPDFVYKSDYDCNKEPYCDWKWCPSIHMPKEAARIFLRVTNVRVERLQDITDEQAEKEGCNDYTSTANGFFDVWDKTMKPKDRPFYDWDANPWVWVIEFERISKEEAYDAR